MRCIRYTHEYCLNSARKYKYRSEWALNELAVYNAARTKGWFDECVAHMRVKKGGRRASTYTHKQLLAIASKFKLKSKWYLEHTSSYNYANKNNLLDTYTQHMKQPLKYTLEDCLKKALMYKTKMAWIRKDHQSYHYAWKHNWLTKCSEHMKGFKYTFECEVKQLENGDNYCIIPSEYKEKCNGKNIKIWIEVIK